MKTYLDAILDRHRKEAELDERDLGELRSRAQNFSDAPRRFKDALKNAEGLGVIAEVKRRSPSKGDLFGDLDPTTLARSYEAGGASCMSVLTDEESFGGSVDDLQQARYATSLPVLRKDFTISERDICDARLMGADCVLLIVAALTDAELETFHSLGTSLSLDVLVEVHDEEELQRAVGVGADLIGVNQRDLVTFEVDTQRAVRLAPLIADSAVKVAESGVRGPTDAADLHEAGFDAVLVGESLVTSGDPETAVRELITAAQ